MHIGDATVFPYNNVIYDNKRYLKITRLFQNKDINHNKNQNVII